MWRRIKGGKKWKQKYEKTKQKYKLVNEFEWNINQMLMDEVWAREAAKAKILTICRIGYTQYTQHTRYSNTPRSWLKILFPR